MNQLSSPPLAGVLHDVALSGEPRLLGGTHVPDLEGPADSGIQAHQAKAPNGADLHSSRRMHPLEEDLNHFEQGKQEGLGLGLRQGREEGYLEGKEAARKELLQEDQATREAIQARLGLLETWSKRLPEAWEALKVEQLAFVEEDLVDLCMTVLCRFLGDKAISREAISHGIRQAAQQACGSGSHGPLAGLFAIHVHPADLHLLQGDLEVAQWFRRHGVTTIPWVADDQIRVGGCVIRSSQGSLDARLETQFAALLEALLQARARQGKSAPEPASGERP